MGRSRRSHHRSLAIPWTPLPSQFLIPVGALVLALGDRGLQAAQQFWLAIWSNAEAAGKHIDVWVSTAPT